MIKFPLNKNIDHEKFSLHVSKTYAGSTCWNDDEFFFIDTNEQNEEKILLEYDSGSFEISPDDLKLRAFEYQDRLNCINGNDYIFKISAKIKLLIENESITVEQAEDYGHDCVYSLTELKQGFYFSAFNYHIAIEVIEEIKETHDEITEYLKNYINEYYPSKYHIGS